MPLRQAVQTGLLGPAAFAMDRGAIASPLGLLRSGSHDGLPVGWPARSRAVLRASIALMAARRGVPWVPPRPYLHGQRRLATLLLMHPLIEAHRAELLALARRRGITGVRVFGSMSRGDGSASSDVDLLVTLAPGTSALALGGLLLDAQELLGRRVDVLTESSLHPALRDSVVAGAVPL